LTVFIAAGVAVWEKANPVQAMRATKQIINMAILLFMVHLPFSEESSWKSLLDARSTIRDGCAAKINRKAPEG
jgi:hypothetical protein